MGALALAGEFGFNRFLLFQFLVFDVRGLGDLALAHAAISISLAVSIS